MRGTPTTATSSKFPLDTAAAKKDSDDSQPAQKSPVVFKSWKDSASCCSEQSAQLRKMWLEPDWTQFKLRSKNYLKDHVKVIPEQPLFELVWFEIFKGEHDDLLHISKSKKSFVQKALAKFGKNVPQLFVVTLIIPGTPLVACVQYFALKKETPSFPRVNREVEGLWKRFFDGDDEFRKDRFKLVPNVPEGPWIVKKSVGNKPAIISHGLQSFYYRGENYLEVVVDVSSDRIANYAAALARSQSGSLKVDMGFVVEGHDESELPEALLGCVEYDHLDLGLAPPIRESARQAKRLNQLAANERDGSDSDAEPSPARGANVGFSFLADSGSDSDASSADERDEERALEDEKAKKEKEEEGKAAELERERGPQRDAAKKSGGKKNKKKKSQKKKQQQQQQGRLADLGDEDEEKAAAAQDVDAILDELIAAETGASLRVDGAAGSAARDQYENSLLGVDLKFINADKEMKRIFGVKEGGAAGRKRADPRNAARLTTKKVRVVTPLDDWPRPPTFVGGGIRWTRANKPTGLGWNSFCNYFEITWSIAYKKAQEEFEVLQQTHDPNLIGHFLARYPYHIDALLQMSEVFQHHGQMDHASDCIKRCMYVLELAWGDQFDVERGNCRMDFHAEHNDGFFRALFLLAKQVGRRGCMRSAFETAKLLLSLDPCGDPMNVLLAIDYYAVTSRQCQFLIDLFDSKTVAVDRFANESTGPSTTTKRRRDAASGEDISALPNLQFSVALAHFFSGDETKAKDMLARALLRFPTILKPLLEKIAASTSSGSWLPVLSSRVFANARSVSGEGSVLQHLLDIYVTRTASVWKVNDVQTFMLRSAQHALASPELVAANPQVLALPVCLDKYMRALPNDYSDEITTLPPDHPMMQPPQLPNGQPLDDAAMAALAEEARAQMDENGNLPADANPLLLFLQTLLPWNRVEGAGARPPPANDGDM